MWPYNLSELAFINSGAGLLCNQYKPKEKKMYALDNALQFYRNTANVVLAYVQNKEIKDTFTKVVDMQVEVTKALAQSAQTYTETLTKTFAKAK